METSSATERRSIFLICPVRNITDATRRKLADHVSALEGQGHQVHWPPRDTDQSDPIGTRICRDNGRAILQADEVHVWYDKGSQGSVFDLGMLFMASIVIGPGKKVVLINPEDLERTEGKSFQNVLLALAD